MDEIAWHPGALLQVSGAYWQTCTLHTGVKLDLFSALADAPATAKRLGERRSADARAVGMLLNALTAMNLLVKDGDCFNLTDAARRFLVKSSPDYIGHMILHHHHLVESWSRMDEAVQSGQPIRSSVSRGDDARRKAFLMGMYNIASQQAPDIAKQVSLERCERLLDLGGGPGTYAIHFCLHNPSLRAVVYDLPTTRPFAEKTINKYNLSDRIDFEAGDFIKDEIPGRYDAVWLSHILHAEGPLACQALMNKATSALNPDGVLIVHDFILDENMAAPLFPALFALNMLQGTKDGQSYSEQQINEMMKEAGLTEIKRLGYCGPTESGIMKGKKR